jgi:adenosylhomocysteine nucleosidase
MADANPASADVPIETFGGRRVLFLMAVEPEFGACLAKRFRPLITGCGPVEAAISTGMALQRLHERGALPELVISLGSAGSQQLPQGDIFQVSSVSWRDIDASAIGVPRGLTPFCDHPFEIDLPTPLSDLPSAKLSTGANINIVTGEAFGGIDAHMVDMETFSICRACQRFDLPLVGLRGISDGKEKLEGYDDWASMLMLLDERLADAVDKLAARMTEGPSWF